MSELSIFIDESGDIGSNSEFYLITLVFHEQSISIEEPLEYLDRGLFDMGFPSDCAIHTGPIIRREDMYANMDVSMRKRVFTRLFSFTRHCGVRYAVFSYKKKEFDDRLKLKARFARDLSIFLGDHQDYFTAFDTVIVYYDNGQAMVTDVVNTVFAANFFDVDFRRVLPVQYRLFQSADLICTLELLRLKADAGKMSASEKGFFGSERKLKKDYLKQLDRMKFGSVF